MKKENCRAVIYIPIPQLLVTHTHTHSKQTHTHTHTQSVNSLVSNGPTSVVFLGGHHGDREKNFKRDTHTHTRSLVHDSINIPHGQHPGFNVNKFGLLQIGIASLFMMFLKCGLHVDHCL